MSGRKNVFYSTIHAVDNGDGTYSAPITTTMTTTTADEIVYFDPNNPEGYLTDVTIKAIGQNLTVRILPFSDCVDIPADEMISIGWIEKIRGLQFFGPAGQQYNIYGSR